MFEITIGSLLDFIVNNSTFILCMIGYHIFYSVIAILAATVIGIGFGVLAVKVRKLSFIIYIADLMQSAPDIVVLALMIPILGIGAICALSALFIKGILPILVNTFVGIKIINKDVIDSARGMGMGKLQILFKVEFPLALPIILAGLRTASVIAVSTLTLASYIGVDGLGVLILRGIAMYEGNILIVGSFLTALLAVCTNYSIGYLEKTATKWKR